MFYAKKMTAKVEIKKKNDKVCSITNQLGILFQYTNCAKYLFYVPF